MRVQMNSNALEEKLVRRAEKYVLPGTVVVSVLSVSLSYMTQRGNYKDKNCYCLVPSNRVYGTEYLDYFSDDIKESFMEKNKGVSNVSVYDVQSVGNLFFDETSLKKCFSANHILDIAAGDDQNGHLIRALQQVHKKNLLYKDFGIPIQCMYLCYETTRGNEREDVRFTLAESFSSAKDGLETAIRKLNQKAPYKAMLNVQILNVTCCGVLRAV